MPAAFSAVAQRRAKLHSVLISLWGKTPDKVRERFVSHVLAGSSREDEQRCPKPAVEMNAAR
jgi:hypothetical protein